MTLLSVVMGTPTDEARADTSIKLLSYGFRFYSSHLLFQAGSVISKPRIWYGENKTVPAGSNSDIYVTTPRGQFANTTVKVALTPNLQAPIKKGQTLGAVNVMLNGKALATYPITALAADPKGGMWRKTSDTIAHHFHNWFGGKKKTTASKAKAVTTPSAPQTAATTTSTTPAAATATPAANTTKQS